MKKFWWFCILVLVLLVTEVLKVYFIMPFPGSQHDENIHIAYFLHKYIWFIRIPGWIGLILLGRDIAQNKKIWKWIVASVLLGLYAVFFYAFNFKFLADKMFVQPHNKTMAPMDKNKVAMTKLVMGVIINGEARAYPVEIMGYHHQVLDTVSGETIMVTYCTVCRTGRVYSPEINGRVETFRLVGMDHFNAMFEDETTHSWWRQVSGEAITGSMKGKMLEEIPAIQTTLESWAKANPQTLVLQPDPDFEKEYKDLDGYDNGTLKGKLEGTDSSAWKPKSWVVGVVIGKMSRAYDWNMLKAKRTINDTLNQIPIVIAIEPDNLSFHAWQRNATDDVFTFTYSDTLKALVDDKTGSVWAFSGECINGLEKGDQLRRIQAYQEFWHSWQQFHPATTKYGVK